MAVWLVGLQSVAKDTGAGGIRKWRCWRFISFCHGHSVGEDTIII